MTCTNCQAPMTDIDRDHNFCPECQMVRASPFEIVIPRPEKDQSAAPDGEYLAGLRRRWCQSLEAVLREHGYNAQVHVTPDSYTTDILVGPAPTQEEAELYGREAARRLGWEIADDQPATPCPCGKTHRYGTARLHRTMHDLARNHGSEMTVCCGGKTYAVSRHYIAFHGLKADQLPALASKGVAREIP